MRWAAKQAMGVHSIGQPRGGWKRRLVAVQLNERVECIRQFSPCHSQRSPFPCSSARDACLQLVLSAAAKVPVSWRSCRVTFGCRDTRCLTAFVLALPKCRGPQARYGTVVLALKYKEVGVQSKAGKGTRCRVGGAQGRSDLGLALLFLPLLFVSYPERAGHAHQRVGSRGRRRRRLGVRAVGAACLS